jgi:hypothetical protein
MTSQGSAQGRFQRACDRGNVLQAEVAARELSHVNPMNALALVVVYARASSPKFEAAAVRWLARLALEKTDIRLREFQLAAAALGSLRGTKTDAAEKVLLRLLCDVAPSWVTGRGRS